MRALIAGQGALPGILAERMGPDTVICDMEMFPSGLPGAIAFRIERRAVSARSVLPVRFGGRRWTRP